MRLACVPILICSLFLGCQGPPFIDQGGALGNPKRKWRSFWREETPPFTRGGDVADSPPSAPMCCRYLPLGKSGGSALTPPPTKTEARPSSWSPSLLAPSAHVVDLILLHAEEALGGGLATCRTTEPRDLLVLARPRREVGPGGNPLPFWGPVVLIRSSCGDGTAHPWSWLCLLLVF